MAGVDPYADNLIFIHHENHKNDISTDKYCFVVLVDDKELMMRWVKIMIRVLMTNLHSYIVTDQTDYYGDIV